MMLSVVFCIAIFVTGAISHMPTVQEFCSHVVATGTEEEGLSLRERVQVLEDKQKQLVKTLIQAGGDLTEAICYMGIKSGEIPNSAMTASSQWSASYVAHKGRLDNPSSYIWHTASGHDDDRQWIQVDFGSPSVVAGVITQGRPTIQQWVKSYKISCGNTVSTMAVVTENGSEKIFSGNRDNGRKVYNRFPQLLTCRYIRVHPQTFIGHMTMRIEFVKGICYDYFTL